MNNFKFLFLAIILCLFSCKTDKKNTANPEEEALPILNEIAYAHGYDQWKNVETIKFTFNVDRDSTHFERTWEWNTKTNDIISISGSDTLLYNRANMDSTAYKANAGFINDRYWLLAPFNLMWDSDNFEYEHSKEAVAPISGKPMQKLTIVYSSEGGYTPGDAYDFYFGDNYLIKEWTFRKGNQAEPSMSTTWENYTEQNGIKLALDHKKGDEPFNLYFTQVSIE